MGLVTHSNLDDVFTYHKPKNDFQIEKYAGLRAAAKEAAKAILDHQDVKTRVEAIEKFGRYIQTHTGDCRDQSEALGVLAAGKAFAGGVAEALNPAPVEKVAAEAEVTQAIIGAIRAALMWANASVALEARI